MSDEGKKITKLEARVQILSEALADAIVERAQARSVAQTLACSYGTPLPEGAPKTDAVIAALWEVEQWQR